MTFTSGARGLGGGPRGTTLAAVLAAVFAYGVLARDPLTAMLAGFLLLLPREFWYFRWLRAWNPTVASGMLGLTFLWPIVDIMYVSGHAGVGLARLAAFLAVWRYQHRRLAVKDHAFLLGVSFFLVLMALTVGGEKPLPPLGLYGLAVVVALFRLHLAAEEQRVLDLARVRGFLRDEAEEVAGRDALSPDRLVRGLSLLALWVVAGGLLLGWVAPRAADGAASAARWMFGGGPEPRPPLPEAKDGPPVFAIPSGARAPVPFGDRLTRDEFVHRLEEEDALAFLTRRTDGEGDDPDPLVRVDVYDYLTSGGRWIRARALEHEVQDAEDGAADGVVAWRPGATDAVEREYLLAPGGDRALPLFVRPFRIGKPRVGQDGAGNVYRAAGDRSPRYVAASDDRTWWRYLPPKDDVAEAPPEFTLLPEGLDAELLRSLVRSDVIACRTAAEKARAIERWLSARAAHYEGDRAPRLGDVEGGDAPIELDPVGFLVTRRWGRNIDFATALAVLLRAEGIPCRLATGYREGAELPDADFRIYRSWHAWAWVEVPLVGAGWTPLDATPDSLAGLSAEEIGGILGAPPEDRADLATKAIAKARRPSFIRRVLGILDGWISALLPGSPDSSLLGQVLSWAVVLLVIGLGLRVAVALTERGLKFANRERGPRPSTVAPVPFYERLVKLLARHGMRRRRAQTPVEFARSVVELWGADFSDVYRLTNAFCAHRYGARPVPAPAQARYIARVRDIERQLRERAERVRSRRGGAAIAALALGAALAVGPAFGQEPVADALAALGSSDAEVRADAVAILEAKGREAVPVLLRTLAGERAKDARTEEVATLIRDLDADEFAVREAATEKLVALGEAARAALEETEKTGSPEASRRARRALARIDAAAIPVDPVAEATARLVRAREILALLRRLGSREDLVPVAAAALANPDLAAEAARTLAALAAGDPDALSPLLLGADSGLRLLGVRALAAMPPDVARPGLLRLTGSIDREVRELAWRGLVTPGVVERLDDARLFIDRGEWGEAEWRLVAVLRECPGYPEAGILLCRRFLSTGRHEEAIRLAEELRAPTAVRDRIVARALAETGDVDAALARLHDAAEAEPGRVESLLLAAELALSAEPPRTGRAIAVLREALGRSPMDATIWARLGGLLEESPATRGEAKECFSRALELDPGNGDYEAGIRRNQ